MPEIPRSIPGQNAAAESLSEQSPVGESLPQRTRMLRRASWARGLSLTSTEYARVAAFQRTAVSADRARIALSDPETAKRRLRVTKDRPFPLNEEQVRRMEDMALDLYRDLREDDRLKTAADRALSSLRRQQEQRAQDQAMQQQQERDNLQRLWETK